MPKLAGEERPTDAITRSASALPNLKRPSGTCAGEGKPFHAGRAKRAQEGNRLRRDQTPVTHLQPDVILPCVASRDAMGGGVGRQDGQRILPLLKAFHDGAERFPPSEPDGKAAALSPRAIACPWVSRHRER